ncbi:hypothetical protein [uncultured Draconibacterium sp.]|uniref:hypothetical protein n=1 Tax=uncultured Draconibacterium sp. TaxID=1573823 RepID=UPI00374A88D7
MATVYFLSPVQKMERQPKPFNCPGSKPVVNWKYIVENDGSYPSFAFFLLD